MAQKKDQSDSNAFDLLNFKGIFFENEHQKYICPITGCHFEISDLCRRLTAIKNQRDKEEQNILGSIKSAGADQIAQANDTLKSSIIQKTSILEITDLIYPEDPNADAKFKATPGKADQTSNINMTNNNNQQQQQAHDRVASQPVYIQDNAQSNAYSDIEIVSQYRSNPTQKTAQPSTKQQLQQQQPKVATQPFNNYAENQTYYHQKQPSQFNKSMPGLDNLQISKSANQFEMDSINRNQALQKLDQIASKIGVQDSGRNNQPSKATKNSFYNTQQYQQMPQHRSSQVKTGSIHIQHHDSSTAGTQNNYVFNKTLYQPNVSSNSGGNIQQQYGLMPMEQSSVYYTQKRQSKFSLKQPGEQAQYANNPNYDSKRGTDQEGGIESLGQKTMKEAYLTNAIEKYKQKRKEDMNNSHGRNNRAGPQASNSQQINPMSISGQQTNFKSFDNTKGQQRTALIEHNRTNSIYNQGMGQTSSNFQNDNRTRNIKITGGLSKGTANKSKLSGSFLGQGKTDYIMGNQGSILGIQPLNSNLGVFGTRKDIPEIQQMKGTATNFSNNHRKLNSYQAMISYSGIGTQQQQSNDNRAGFSPLKMKAIMQQKKAIQQQQLINHGFQRNQEIDQ